MTRLFHLLACVLASLVLFSGGAPAPAGERAHPAVGPRHAAAAAHRRSARRVRRYFVEFRARGGTPTGHTYVLTGYRTGNGKTRYNRHYGFFAPPGLTYPLGLLAAPAVVGKSWLDERIPSTVRYRRYVSRGTYLRVIAYLERKRKNPPPFGLFLYNCNDFAGDVARIAGLRKPKNNLAPSESYVRALRKINGGAPAERKTAGKGAPAMRRVYLWRRARR